MTTLLGVPLGILPQVIDTRYFFVLKSTMHSLQVFQAVPIK